MAAFILPSLRRSTARSFNRTPATFLPLRRFLATEVEARAVVYSQRGEPSEVLRALTFTLPVPREGEARVRFLLSPQNPADLNVIQGSYPERPKPKDWLSKREEPVFIGGNEGLAVIEDLPDNVQTDLRVGDWVVMGKPQQGTWTSRANLPLAALFPVPKNPELTSTGAATLSINPGTAYRLLKDFAQLRPGDYMVQNGANSQVGLAVIQLAKAWGIKTINFVRDRKDMQSSRSELKALGADHVFTYDELQAEGGRPFKSQLKSLIADAPISLGLNCVSGPSTTAMMKLLSPKAQLVTYGGMSMKPVSVPSSLFIFKQLECKGFWMTTWYATCSAKERSEMYDEIVGLVAEGKFREPQCEVVKLEGSDEQIAQQAKNAISTVRGKKVVFTFSEDM